MDVFTGQYLPNWLMVLVTASVALIPAVAALVRRRSGRADRLALARADAERLTATWARGRFRNVEDVWGIVVTNTSDSAFSDVEISVVGNNHADGAVGLTLPLVGPGRYLVRSNKLSDPMPWGDAVPVDDLDEVTAVARSSIKTVTRVDYSDSTGQRWTRTRGGEVLPWRGPHLLGRWRSVRSLHN